MNKHKNNKSLISLLRSSIEILFHKPLIFYPYVISIFIQLFVLEILYFAPRYPLSLFFAPLIRQFWGEMFLHFPFNLLLLPVLFQYVKTPIYIISSSYLIGIAIIIIAAINEDQTISFKSAAKKVLPRYIHLIFITSISYSLFYGFSQLYGLVIKRAFIIHSETGIFYLIKRIVLDGTPFFSLLISVFVSTLLVFMMPLLLLEKKNLFAAFWTNLKKVIKSFWFVLGIVLLPTLLYLPVLLLSSNLSSFGNGVAPEIRMSLTIANILIIVIIDAIVYTAITLYYLFDQEN